jgi:tRNA pseudouridine38-40 synthase
MNYRLTIQYDGTDFHGWQVQNGRRTVQGELERALRLLNGNDVNLHGAGRTDAGVHAEGQVASVNLRRELSPDNLLAAINGNVGRDVRVIEVETVPDDFHARFAAKGKTYRYSIFNERFMSPFLPRYALHDSRRLDLNAMVEAAALLIGEHEWTAFSSAQIDVKSRVRTVTALDVNERICERTRGRLLEITASADGFLRYMVRSIVGGLMAVGRGEMSSAALSRALVTGERPNAIVTAEACGLTLVRVHY